MEEAVEEDEAEAVEKCGLDGDLAVGRASLLSSLPCVTLATF